MKHKLLLLYAWWVRAMLLLLPDIPFIMRFRGKLYSLAMPKAGRDFQVSASTIIRNLEKLSVGNNVYLAPFVVINAIESVKLNDEVMIGFSSVIVSGNHTRLNGSFRYGKSKATPVEVGSGCWIGANCTLVAGSNLPAGSLLAANSILSKAYIESDMVYGGVPAKPISNIT